MMVVQTALDAALGDMIAAAARFDPAGVFLGVATAIVDRRLATTMADITEATGAMATRQAVTAWSAIHHLNDGSAVVDGPDMRFVPANAGEAQTVAGWFLADALAAGNLLAYELLPAPVPLPDQFAEWGIVLRLVLSTTGILSASSTFNG